MIILFFDTETNGLPRDYRAPSSDVDNWPRLVQIGWQIYDDSKVKLLEAEHVVMPDGWEIPASISLIHGITNNQAIEYGGSIAEILQAFSANANLCDLVVGHNVQFDLNIVGAEYARLGKESPLANKPSACTMLASTDYCKIMHSNGRGVKWPKLSELYEKLFGEDMGHAHTALSDISNTAKCFFELQKRGVIKQTVDLLMEHKASK